MATGGSPIRSFKSTPLSRDLVTVYKIQTPIVESLQLVSYNPERLCAIAKKCQLPKND